MPILFFSSFTDEATIRQAERISPWGYLTKGAGIETLDTRIRGILKESRLPPH